MRITAVVVLILFAAGILITYFNSIAAQRMEFRDSENDSRLMAAEFNLTTTSSPEVNISTLLTNAQLALRLNHDAEFIGFFKKFGPDSFSKLAFAGQDLSDSEITSFMAGLKNYEMKNTVVSSVNSDNTLYYWSKLFQNDGKVWGYVFIKISLAQVRQIVLRNWITGVGITLAISIFASVLLLFAMRLTFLRPFEDLANAMREAAEGKRDTRLSLTAGAEFRTLSSIFNEMMTEAQKAHEIIRSEVKQHEDYNMRLQNEITIAIDALHEKSGEIVSLQERLRTFESQAALGKIAAKLAHEIGSPLNAIYTSVQLMLEKDIQDEERVKLQVIERQVETMITIINQLLQTRRIAVPSKKNVVLKDLIEETRLVTEPRLEGKPIDLNIQLENPSAIICADPVQIQQVLINLFNNSIEAIESRKKIPSGHHTDGRGKIEVKVYEDYELRISDFGFPNIRFDVSDNGTGVPGEIVSQLFNDYISSKKPNGNGIGLVICKEIIDRHGGKIFLSRNSEKGSTFSIILPIADSGRDILYER